VSSLARICFLGFIIFSVPLQADESDQSCAAHVAQWLDPASGEVLKQNKLFNRLGKASVVLLGEAHTSAAHHRWQHYMLAALHSRWPNMVVGFEMMPRAAQAVLDDWSAGRIGEQEMLEGVRWREVWGFDPDLYLPLLHFVRQNRLPSLALNVDRELVSMVGEKGWEAVDKSRREGLSEPAPASQAYRESLARLYAFKLQMAAGNEDVDYEDEAELEKVLASGEFANFVEAQLTWDRAMAEALAEAHRRDPDAIVVGIVGRGHLEHGYGIPHQLADLGIDAVDVLLPLDVEDQCNQLEPDLASAVFIVDDDGDAPSTPRPRLGIVIEDDERGVQVLQVVDDSVAADSGIQQGDIIQNAAGFETRTTAELIEIIGRQAPGTWLPLRLLRGEDVIDLVARFPQSFD